MAKACRAGQSLIIFVLVGAAYATCPSTWLHGAKSRKDPTRIGPMARVMRLRGAGDKPEPAAAEDGDRAWLKELLAPRPSDSYRNAFEVFIPEVTDAGQSLWEPLLQGIRDASEDCIDTYRQQTSSKKALDAPKAAKRGLFIVVVEDAEDHSQILQRVNASLPNATIVPFPPPDATSNTIRLLTVLTQCNRNVTQKTLHMLRAAARWEQSVSWLKMLMAGGDVVLRCGYSYTDVAASVADGLDAKWCMGLEQELLAPDCVLVLGTPSYSVDDKTFQSLQDDSWSKISTGDSNDLETALVKLSSMRASPPPIKYLWTPDLPSLSS